MDDWSTYAHDQQRTGLETQTTGITASTVANLSLAWTQPIDPSCGQNGTVAEAYASPIVVEGVAYVVSMCGNVYALNSADGSIKWGPVNVTTLGGQQCVFTSISTPGCVRGTPTLDGNMLIVPVYGYQTGTCTYDDNDDVDTCTPSDGYQKGGQLVALNASNGQVVWYTTPLSAGVFRGEPLVLNGIVYEGVAGGDMASGCVQGGMVAFNESTGAQESAIFHATNAPNDGGSVWSGMSTNGTYIFAGTGNTCSGPDSAQETGAGVLDYEDSVLELSPATLTPELDIPALNPFTLNSDVGSNQLLWENNLYFNGKNAVLYAYDLSTSQSEWTATLAAPNGQGGYGGPTTDGTAIVAASGTITTNPTTAQLEAFSPSSGTKLWSVQSQDSGVYGYAAFVPGVAFAPIDLHVYAFASSTGQVLWESPATADYFYASPAVVPSGLYLIDASGNVYCYKLPGSYSGKESVAKGEVTRHIRPLQHFSHSGSIWNRG